MTCKLLTIAAMSLSLGATTALATQIGTPGMSTMQNDSMPSEWEGNIGDAFYSDTDLGTLRSDEEMRTNWENLSDEDKGAARDYCNSIAMDNEQAMTGAGGDMSSGTRTGQDGTTAGVDTASRSGGASETTGTTTGTGAITADGTTAGVDTSSQSGASGTTGTTTGTGAITADGTTAGVDTSSRTGGASGSTGTEAGMTDDARAAMHHASVQRICETLG